MSKFYLVSGSDDEGVADIVKSWNRPYWRTRDSSGDIEEHRSIDPPGLAIACPECRNLRENASPVNVPIVRVEIRSALHWPGYSDIGLIRKDLIEAIGREILSQYLFLGRVVDEDGKAYSDFETYVGRYHNSIRGSRNPTLRRCQTCGRRIYSAVGRRYL